MPDNTKTLYETPAPSGAADALFNMFKQNTEMEQYAKKKDIDTNAAVKLKEQENKFTTGLETMRNNYDMEKTVREHAYNESLLMKRGTALGETIGQQATQMSNQTGEPILGLTQKGPAPLAPGSTFETPGAQGIAPGADMGYNPSANQFSALPINPMAAPEVATIFGKAVDDIYKRKEATEGRSYLEQRDALNRTLGMTSIAEQTAAKDLAAMIRAADPKDARIPVLERFAQPGAQRADWEKTVPTMAQKFEDSKTKMRQITLQGQFRSSLMTQHDAALARIVELKAKVAGGGPAAAKAITNLRKEQNGLNDVLNGLEASIAQTTANIAAGSYETSAEQNKAMQEQYKARTDAAKVRDQLSEINMLIHQYNSAPPPPSTDDKAKDAAAKQALGAKVLQDMGIKDPSKMTDKQKIDFTKRIKAGS